MDKAIQMDVKGIKCDADGCDYVDYEVEFDPEKYLNAPCPKCGAPLLTQEDYETYKTMVGLVDSIADIFEGVEFDEDTKMAHMEIKLNGTGVPELGDIEIIEDGKTH